MPDILLAMAAMLVVVSAVQPLARRLLVSDAVLLALVGMLIGAGATFLLSRDLGGSLNEMAATFAHFPVNSQVFLFVFLPALVFHGALSLDVRRLARDIAPVLLLAVVAVVATTAAVGFALQPIAGQKLTVCLLLGAIVATTDPSAVIGVFGDIGADGAAHPAGRGREPAERRRGDRRCSPCCWTRVIAPSRHARPRPAGLSSRPPCWAARRWGTCWRGSRSRSCRCSAAAAPPRSP